MRWFPIVIVLVILSQGTSAEPPAISDLVVEDEDENGGNVTLTWTRPDTDQYDHYTVFWHTAPFDNTSLPPTRENLTNRFVSQHRIEGLDDYETYYVAVATVDDQDELNLSSVEMVIPTPDEPPTFNGTIPTVSGLPAGEPWRLNLTDYFSDEETPDIQMRYTSTDIRLYPFVDTNGHYLIWYPYTDPDIENVNVTACDVRNQCVTSNTFSLYADQIELDNDTPHLDDGEEDDGNSISVLGFEAGLFELISALASVAVAVAGILIYRYRRNRLRRFLIKLDRIVQDTGPHLLGAELDRFLVIVDNEMREGRLNESQYLVLERRVQSHRPV